MATSLVEDLLIGKVDEIYRKTECESNALFALSILNHYSYMNRYIIHVFKVLVLNKHDIIWNADSVNYF